ncbi:MAG TPA: glycosyltransferase family 4 protein [Bryobacteraceae bacterium]|nr:glycosyltransferase family 4 protein [Bryobacteraceae bacterium]
MKILWVKTDFLHPTNRGGQIRTLETVKRLHQKHEVHYIAFEDSSTPEGPERAPEYCSRHYGVPHYAPEKNLLSPTFVGQLATGLISRLPVAVNRWRSPQMRQEIAKLDSKEKFDAIICDFLFPAPNIPDLGKAILFQHNVEAQIWRRHVEHAGNAWKRGYFQLQATRMETYEREVCRRVKRVIAVSENDAQQIRRNYGITGVTAIPTGVDIDFFCPPPHPEPKADLLFLGSMDWMPNIEGIQWFVREILPLIQAKLPSTTFAIAGRKPSAKVQALAGPGILVTGTVPDVRPWLWGSKLSIVPLRIGGGTRLKIYESMAARIPVVSTTVGAEGLETQDGGNIALADSPAAFAGRCVELLDSAAAREKMAQRGWEMVAAKYSWESVTAQFESLLP